MPAIKAKKKETAKPSTVAPVTKQSLRDQLKGLIESVSDAPPKQITTYLYDQRVYAFYSLFAVLTGKDRSRLIEDALSSMITHYSASDPKAAHLWKQITSGEMKVGE